MNSGQSPPVTCTQFAFSRRVHAFLRVRHKAVACSSSDSNRPIWTLARTDLAKITARRGGVETTHNRAWSAGAGAGALGAALALMPWCLSRVANVAGPAAVTVDLHRFQERGGLFLWEAFVSGEMKVVGAKHHDDARIACQAFIARWPDLASDIPAERAVNHAVSSAMAAGLAIDHDELRLPALVVGVSLRTVVEPATT